MWDMLGSNFALYIAAFKSALFAVIQIDNIYRAATGVCRRTKPASHQYKLVDCGLILASQYIGTNGDDLSVNAF